MFSHSKSFLKIIAQVKAFDPVALVQVKVELGGLAGSDVGRTEKAFLNPQRFLELIKGLDVKPDGLQALIRHVPDRAGDRDLVNPGVVGPGEIGDGQVQAVLLFDPGRGVIRGQNRFPV